MSSTTNPDMINEFEVHTHAAFYQSLVACEKESKSLDSPYFTMCMKASGINFSSVYNKWLDYKIKLILHKRINQPT